MNLKYAKRSEDTEQITVIQWANWHLKEYPELKWLHHIPNGGSRNRAEAIKLKQMGVKAGISDLHLPYRKGIYCGLYIELKYGDNKQQSIQKEFLADMEAAGHYVSTCYSAQVAISVLEEYCKLPSIGAEESLFQDVRKYTKEEKMKIKIEKNMMQIANNSILKGDGVE